MSKLPVIPTKINIKNGNGTPGSFSGDNYKPIAKPKNQEKIKFVEISQ